MSTFLTIVLFITAFLALYWVFYGQRKQSEMLNPKRKTELKAILFDLDGVVVDSFENWFMIFNSVRKKYRLKPFSKDEFRKKVWGGSIENDAHFFPTLRTEDIRKEYESLVKKNLNKRKLMPSAKEVLKKIRSKKIKTGLVTNTQRNPTDAQLTNKKIKQYFDVVVTADDVERPKPYPDLILKACEKLQVAPDEIMLIGDTNNDYKAAKAAGSFSVGLNAKGDLVIKELKDLLHLL